MKPNKKSRLKCLQAFFSAAILVVPLLQVLPAVAQDVGGAIGQETGGLQEIVVTAQRREQSLIDVPAAVTALSGDELRELNVTNVPDIAQQIPNFNVQYERGLNTTPTFELRGISSDGLASRLNESSVAIYSDEVYLGDENMLNGLVFDMQRVEVLRGPQGTLFGRNTTGGLLDFISQAPTHEFSGYSEALYGQNNTVTLDGALSGPISDRVRVRLAGMFNYNDGYYENLDELAGHDGVPERLGGTNTRALRLTVDMDLAPRTALRLIASGSQDDSYTTPPYIFGVLKPGTTGAPPYTRSQTCSSTQIFAARCITVAQIFGLPPNTDNGPGVADTVFPANQLRAYGGGGSITGKLTHDFDWATLTSIANFTNNRFTEELDGGRYSPDPAIFGHINVPRINNAHQFSEELRLNGSAKAFDWVMGAFYYSDDKYNDTLINAPAYGAVNYAIAAVDSHSYALFGQLDNHLNDEVTLTIGARYTGDDRNLAQAATWNGLNEAGTYQDIRAYMVAHGISPVSDSKDLTGKFGLTWKPSEDDSYYVSLSRGIKGTGYNGGFSPDSTIAANASIAGPTGEETLDAAELGAKNRFFDHRLSINSDVFFYNYQGKQESIAVYDPVTGTAAFNYENVGTAQIWGVETEIKYQPDLHWDFDLSAASNENKITKTSIVTPDNFGVLTSLYGKHLTGTPPYTFNAIVGYHLPVNEWGVFTLQSEVNGFGHRDFSIVNDPLARDQSHVITNFRILWRSPAGTYYSQAYLTNAFNTAYPLNLVDTVTAQAGGLVETAAPGRLWGVKFGVRF